MRKTLQRFNLKKTTSIFKSAFQWFLIILGSIVFAVALRVFFLAKFSIPTPSMEPAIMAGDQIIVSKLTPGPRIIRNLFSLNQDKKPDIHRLNGFAVQRNDVLIFNFPYSNWSRLDMDMNVYYAKRCVGLPGDTFYIENGFYKVKGVDDALGYYDTQHAVSQKTKDAFGTELYQTYPYHEMFDWNIHHFGPLYIPKAGELIEMNTANLILYRNLIEYETKEVLTEKGGIISLGEKVINHYAFTQNYYFMAGDFSLDSKDSRYWGLLPEEHIVGKASFVWNSRDIHTKKTKWNRFLKKIQ